MKDQKYYCPMHCEEEKTYPNKGNCPVCKMDLVPENFSDEKSDKHIHSHHKDNADSEYYCSMLTVAYFKMKKSGLPRCGSFYDHDKLKDSKSTMNIYKYGVQRVNEGSHK